VGKAIDTIAVYSTQAGAAAFPTQLASLPAGDSLTIRSFPVTAKARIQSLIYSAGGSQKFRIQSPLMHDNVTGFTFAPAEVPALFQLPPDAPIGVSPVDTLSVYGAIAGAGTIVAGIVVDYDDLTGVSAHVYDYSDIRPHVKYYKSIEVDNLAIAVGAWTDTPITNTENQLHANKWYAVLGYQAAAACDIIGVKGSATGNLRQCGPGGTQSLDLSSYFIYMSEQTGKPRIPVFNANDRAAFYVSQFNHAAVAAGNASVYLMVAELGDSFTPKPQS